MATSATPLPNNLSLWRYKRKNKAYTEDLGNGATLTLMLIPAGEFMMGAPEDEPKSQDDERPQHLVKISSPFLMGRYPVTQAQWREVAGYEQIDRELNPDPSRFKGDNRPVENVSWDDTQEFCQRLFRKTNRVYRLPSEAEWEYACRAGTTTPFHFGETIIPELGNYNTDRTYNDSVVTHGSDFQESIAKSSDEQDTDTDRFEGSFAIGGSFSDGGTTGVGTFPANAWGLHDMHGNVLEWCEDDYHRSYSDAPSNGSAWVEADRTKTRRILRGGSWNNYPVDCRSAVRNVNARVNRYFIIGFRVCCVPPRILP